MKIESKLDELIAEIPSFTKDKWNGKFKEICSEMPLMMANWLYDESYFVIDLNVHQQNAIMNLAVYLKSSVSI